MRIRPFAASDQAAVRQLILEGLGGVDAGAIFVVAEEEGEIIGTGALVPEGERVSRIVRVSVSDKHRRKGVGKAIVTYLMLRATYRGDEALLVETNHDWPDAVGLYRSLGFVEYARDSVSAYMQMSL